MLRTSWRRVLHLAAGGGLLSVFVTLNTHDYDVNSIGAIRLGRAAFTVFKIGLHYKIKFYSNQFEADSQQYLERKSLVHREAAEMLLDLCRANQGVYVKVGQHIGALDYLVPSEYVDVLKVLHANAPKSSFKSIYKVLKEDLKREPLEIFESIEEEPLGAASLAQVHKAVLKEDKAVVAVKVQHPLVKRNSLVDMKTMEVLVNIMSVIFEEFNFQWLVNETKRNLPKELDFSLEAENAEKVQDEFKCFKWLKVPKVYRELTTSRVLTMEFVEGNHVTDLKYIKDNEISCMEVSSKLGELYAHMIFKNGFVHSDPHPGNILLHKNPNGNLDIVLLDHGLYADLSKEFRWNYSKLWLSILNRNHTGMKNYSEKLGIGNLYPLFVCMVTGRTWDSINDGIVNVQYSVKEKIMFQEAVPNFLSKIGEILATVNREMLLILKTNDLLRGIEFTLRVDKRHPSFLVMSKCCIESTYEESLRRYNSRLQTFYLKLWKEWTFVKLNLYFFFLSVKSRIIDWNS